jgi:hypothetical protein
MKTTSLQGTSDKRTLRGYRNNRPKQCYSFNTVSALVGKVKSVACLLPKE